MTHEFLSDDWMNAARAIRAKYEGQTPKIAASIRINQVITEVPFGSGEVKSFIDTSSGDMQMDLGELENPDAVVTTDWATARAMFALGDQAAAMQAFMSGKIKVTGDMTKLMTMNANPPSDNEKAAAEEIKNITA